MVRLVDFDQTTRPSYVALSYCWGSQCSVMTATKATVPLLQNGIAISRMPATLRDAIIMTTKLGSKFIWIDALCIIQDDPADWDRESGKMSTVYAQALVTIIASSAISSDQGFLEHARDQSIKVGQVETEDGTTDILARVIYDWGHHRGGPQAADSSYTRWFDPVEGRGWTLQERLLSGRYINFTSGEVQWGCVSQRACECGQALYGKLYEPLPGADKWFRIVEEYCTRRLTYAADRLTAIAGLARAMAPVLQERWYVAGLWLSPRWTPLTLQSLLWRRKNGSPLAAFSKEYVSPSFSWASQAGEPVHVEGEVFSGGTFPSSIRADDVQNSTADAFGSIDSAVLRVHGPLIAARLKWDNSLAYEDMKVGIKIEQSSKSYSSGCRVDGLLESVPWKEDQYTARRRSEDSVVPEASFEDVEVCLLPIIVRDLNYTVSSLE
jgi:hypothetical protein